MPASSSHIMQITLRGLLRPGVVIGRRRGRAAVEPIRTPRVEGASGWKLTKQRDRALDGAQRLAWRTAGNRREQAARVRMLRPAEDRAHGSGFDDASGVHDG